MSARLASALAAFLFAAAPALLAQTVTRPNVLFIAVDDLVPRIGPYDDPNAVTPRMDQLASTGVTFLNHHTQWSVCGPSRAALTTSLTPEETNVIGFKKIRDKNFLPSVVTLPQHFRNQGYETACTGKFHDNRTVGTPVEISALYPDGVMDDGRDVDDPASWSIPYLNAGSGFSPAVKNAVDATDQPDSLYEDNLILNAGLSLLNDLATAGGSAPGDKPFFLAVGFKKPHLPFVAPKTYWDLYDRAALPLATFSAAPAGTTAYNAATLASNSELLGGGDDTTNGYEPFRTNAALLNDPASQRELIHGYYACVSFVDKLVGDLLDQLASTDDPRHPGKKLSETTIVVLWGDHGFNLGEHGHWAKHTAMDQATASPLIIRDPRRLRDSTNNRTTRPVGTIDIYPTLCELAGLPLPDQPTSASTTNGRPLRGRSLAPLFDDPATRIHHGTLSQFNISGQYGYAYRTDRFRYIEWVNLSGNMNDGNARRDLFDLTADPAATRNVVNDPAYAAVAWQLSRSLRAESTTRGTGRLKLAAPLASGGAATLPDTRIRASDTPGSVRLDWLPAAGVVHEIVFSDDLINWALLDSVQGSYADLPLTTDRAFYKVRPGPGSPPLFASDPLVRGAAVEGEAYLATLAGSATDADAGSTVTYSRIDGPAWLQVATDGTLSGTPPATETGAHYFTVAATDNDGFTTTARLQITVAESAPPPPPASITEVLKQTLAGSGTYGGTTLFANISVLAGDMVVIAHSNNKNTSTNTISLGGLGANVVQAINSGSTGTTSSAWVFSSLITEPGVFSPTLDTSSTTKSVSHASSIIVLRPVNGTLSVAASDTSVATSGATSLALDLIPAAAVSGAYGVISAATSVSTFTTNPDGWTQHADGASRRRTALQPSLSGVAFSPSFGIATASDLALAGVVIRVSP